MKSHLTYGLIAILWACVPGPESTGETMQQEHSGPGAALLVIDLQRGLFDRPTHVHDEDSLLRNISGLVSAAHAAEIPVVFFRHSNKMLVRHTEPWELHPGIQPGENDRVLDKTHGDAFEDTELDSLLRERSIDTVYVTGLVTEGCVRTTCLGALKRGYHVILVSDAHSSFHHDAANRIRHWNKMLAGKLDGVVPAGRIDFVHEKQADRKDQSTEESAGATPAANPLSTQP